MSTIVNIIADKSELAMRRKMSLKRLIHDEPYFQAAIDEVRQDIAHSWANTNYADTMTREALYQELAALDSVVGRLTAYANDATFGIKKKVEEDNGLE